MIDTADGSVVWESEAVTSSIRDVAVHPEGHRIACVTHGGGPQILDAADGSVCKELPMGVHFACAFSQDGKWLALGAQNWSVSIVDWESSREHWSKLHHAGAVTAVRFAQEDERLITSSLDGTVRIWDTSYGEVILTLADQLGEKYDTEISSRGRWMATAARDGAIMVRRFGEETSASEESWRTIFEDDFERERLGEGFFVAGGQWTIRDGELVASAEPASYLPSTNAALLYLPVAVGDDVEIRYDVRLREPMMMSTNISDRQAQNQMGTGLLAIRGLPFNHGHRGATISRTVDGNFTEIASRRDGLDFEMDRVYRLKTVRRGSRLSFWIDDEMVREVTVEIPTPLPHLILHGTFSPAGETFVVDNVRVRIPESSVTEREATSMVVKAFQQTPIRPLVVRRIIDQADVSAEVRQSAIEIASRWSGSEDDTLEQIFEAVTEDRFDTDEYQVLLDWLNEDCEMRGGKYDMVRAATAMRCGKRGPAWDSLKRSMAGFESYHGVRDPRHVAVAALLMHDGGKTDQASERLHWMRQLMLAGRNARESENQTWLAEMEGKIESLKFTDEQAQQIERLWEMDAAAHIGEVDLLRQVVTADTKFVSAAGPSGQGQTHEASAEDWLRCEQMYRRGCRSGYRLTRFSCRPDPDRPGAYVSDYIALFPLGFVRYLQIDEFENEPSNDGLEPKLIRRITRPVRFRYKNDRLDFDAESWPAFMKQVADTDQADDAGDAIGIRLAAGMASEAYERASAHASSDPSNPHAQHLLAQAAYLVRDPAAMSAAAAKTARLEPLFQGVPLIRTASARLHAPEEPADLGSGVRVRVPSFFRTASDRLLASSADPLASYQVNEHSLVGIVTMDKKESLAEAVDSIIARRETAYSMETMERRVREVDGFDAEEFVQAGMGIGRAVLHNQGSRTMQRFVVVDRKDDRLLLLCTAFANEFVQRDAEFEQFLQMMSLR